MYGETKLPARHGGGGRGLSPHVRGNRTGTPLRGTHRGSIPACTGKPTACRVCRMACGVYPRMYGETIAVPASTLFGMGLSPHVRGNPPPDTAGVLRDGSIPACTGKPRSARAAWCPARVYPRMYGETSCTPSRYAVMAGLSPHVRGNLLEHLRDHPQVWSIPACTGKPPCCLDPGMRIGVYPRMYGETRHKPPLRTAGAGLSPHVRGNLCVKMTHS